MKFIGHILALLLAAALGTAVSLWAIGSTLGSPAYLERTAEQTHLYDNLAAAVPGLDTSGIRDQAKAVLPQFVNYIAKGGPAPVVDFGAGPVPLADPDTRLTAATQTLNLANTFAPAAAIALIVLIIAVTGHRRLPILARGFFESAIGVALSAGVLWLSPGFVIGALSQPEALPFKPPLTPFINQLFHGVAIQLAVAAAALLVISIVIRLGHGAARIRSHFHRPAKTKAPAPLPPRPEPNKYT